MQGVFGQPPCGICSQDPPGQTQARKEVTLHWLCSGSEHMVRIVDVPAAVSKGDIREALHCFGATSV